MNFFGQLKMYQWKSVWKALLKRTMRNYVVLAEKRNEVEMKERVIAFSNSPASVDSFMKAFDYKNSKFPTMCHSDLWTSQIMFALNEDGKGRIQYNSQISFFNAGSPKRVKILDFQGLTLGHPAMDIWSIVYSCTDPEYRAASLESDLAAYYAVLAGYLETKVDYTEFRQEVMERRTMGMVMNGTSSCISVVSDPTAGIFCVISLSPTQLPSPAKEPSKFSRAAKDILTADDKPDDHPDIREIRRRVWGNLTEMINLNLI